MNGLGGFDSYLILRMIGFFEEQRVGYDTPVIWWSADRIFCRGRINLIVVEYGKGRF